MKIKEQLQSMTGLGKGLKGALGELRGMVEEGQNVEAIYHAIKTAEGHVNDRVYALRQAVTAETKADAEAKAKADAEPKSPEPAKAGTPNGEASKESSPPKTPEPENKSPVSNG